MLRAHSTQNNRRKSFSGSSLMFCWKIPFIPVHFIRLQWATPQSALIGQRVQIYLVIFAWLFVAGNRILRLRWYVGSFHRTECRNEAMNRTEYLQRGTAYETQGNMEAVCHAPLLHYLHQSVSHMWKCSTTSFQEGIQFGMSSHLCPSTFSVFDSWALGW